MFNLLAMEHSDTDSEDRPLTPPKILSTKTLINPFDDIIQRNKPELKTKEIQEVKETQDVNKGKTARDKPTVGIKNASLLSFGNEDEDEEEEKSQVKAVDMKIKSSHDALNDPRLLKQPVVSIEELE